MTHVPLLDLKAQLATIRDDVDQVLRRVVESQIFILGAEVQALESEIAAFTGARHAIGCASGTDALVLSLAALGVRSDDEIVTTPFSFFASASCAALLGARPRFVDIDPRTFNLDPALLESAIGERTRAIVPVHLFGQCAEMDPILEIAERRGVPVVEDACQAIGATYRSARRGGTFSAGSMGTTGAFSFFPSKNLGGFGDGGMVITSDDDLAASLRALRVHGERTRYHHQTIGWNSRLDALQAAVLRVKLPRLSAWSAARATNAAAYDRLLTGAGLVGSGRVTLPVRSSASSHIFNQYTLRVADRDALSRHLTERGIGWAIYYPVPLHQQECFRDLGYRAGDLPVAEKAAGEVISLPVYPELTSDQISRVVDGIASFYGS